MANNCAVFVTCAAGFVAKVVRFIDHNQAICAPIKPRQIDAVGFAGLSRQVGVMQHRVMEVVFLERVALLPELRRVEFPVFAEFLWAKHQHPLVFCLIVTNDRQRRVGFTKPDTVGKNAAVVLLQTVDNSSHAIALKWE